ncbi:MAG: hypothetical protein Q9199_003368 [Rusavskia elegans]
MSFANVLNNNLTHHPNPNPNPNPASTHAHVLPTTTQHAPQIHPPPIQPPKLPLRSPTLPPQPARVYAEPQRELFTLAKLQHSPGTFPLCWPLDLHVRTNVASISSNIQLNNEIADDGHYSWTHDVVITRLIVYLIKLKNGKLCWCEWKGPGDAIHEDRLIGYPTKDQVKLISAFQRRPRRYQALDVGPSAQQKTKPEFTMGHAQGQEDTTRQLNVNPPLRKRCAAVIDDFRRAVDISLDDDQYQFQPGSVKKPPSSECYHFDAVTPNDTNIQSLHRRNRPAFEATHSERLSSSAGPSYANSSSQRRRLNHDSGTERGEAMASTTMPQPIQGPHRYRCAQVPELERLILTMLSLRGDHNALFSIDRSSRDIVRQYVYEQIFDADDDSSTLSRHTSKGLVDHHDGGYVSADRAPPPDLSSSGQAIEIKE